MLAKKQMASMYYLRKDNANQPPSPPAPITRNFSASSLAASLRGLKDSDSSRRSSDEDRRSEDEGRPSSAGSSRLSSFGNKGTPKIQPGLFFGNHMCT